MELKIQKLHELAIVPRYAHPGDAGLDLFAIEEHKILPGKVELIKTGIAIALPDGYEAQIRSRSGLALNQGISVLNSPGTVDAGYRGEIGVILINHSQQVFLIVPGMKIAQMIITSFIRIEAKVVEDLDSTSRDIKGFGSTGST